MTTSAGELGALREGLRRLLGTHDASAVVHPDLEWRSGWGSLADLGVAALCAAKTAGGFGAEVGAALVASRELGAALHASPYAAIVTTAAVLSRCPDPDLVALGTQIAAGEHVPVVALLDPGARVGRDGDSVRVDGCARTVLGAGDHDSLLVVPSASGPLVVVRRGDGDHIGRRHDLDVSRSCADVHLRGAVGRAVPRSEPDREWALRLHGVLLAGDALGGVERMHTRTVAYAAHRVAFGRPIGGFQAVQHRLVEHGLRVRGLVLLAEAAARALGAGADDAARRGLLAEAGAARHVVSVLHDLLQLTGAIGFTWEHGLHFYERRAHMDARAGRNPRSAYGGLAARAGWAA